MDQDNDVNKEPLEITNAVVSFVPSLSIILAKMRAHRSKPCISGRTGKINGVETPLTRHHIIPHSCFKEFGKKIKESDLFEGHFESIIKNEVNQKLSSSHKYALPPNLKSVIDRTVDFIVSLFEWMPGNMFFGPPPKDRSDDPKDSFEEGARKVVGDPHFKSLKTMHDRMLNFINREDCRSKENVQLIMIDFEDMIEVGHFEYHPEDWDVDSKGKYSLKPAVELSQPMIRGETGIINGQETVLSRYYIIPNLDFYDFAKVALKIELVKKHYDSLLRNDINQRLSFSHQFAAAPNDQSVYDRTDQFMKAMFKWMPGNIFYGPPPPCRSDNQENREFFVEEHAGRVVGDHHFQSLMTMRDRMVNYTHVEDYRTEENFYLIMQDFEYMVNIGPFEFNAEDWNVDSEGKYSLGPSS